MSRARLALPSAALVLGLALLAGCGDHSAPAAAGKSSAAEDSGAAAGAGAERSGTPQTVDCPAAATAVTLPADFPAPLPKGTVVVAVQKRSGNLTVVTGVVPSGQKNVLKELQAAYPKAGLTLTEGETEEHDAESNFTGARVTGRWGIRELTACSPVATRIDLVVQPS